VLSERVAVNHINCCVMHVLFDYYCRYETLWLAFNLALYLTSLCIYFFYISIPVNISLSVIVFLICVNGVACTVYVFAFPSILSFFICS